MNPPGKRRRLSRYFRLPAAERRVLSQALCLLSLNRVGLSVIGYRRWYAFLERWLPSHQPEDASRQIPVPVTSQRVAQLVYTASGEGVATGACLERTLTLWWLLRRRHFPAEVRFGARKEGGGFEAHAWVELDGVALNETPLRDYVAF